MEQLHLTAIRHRAALFDQTGDWPDEDLDALAAAGAMRWAVPKEFGGEELSSLGTASAIRMDRGSVGLHRADPDTTGFGGWFDRFIRESHIAPGIASAIRAERNVRHGGHRAVNDEPSTGHAGAACGKRPMAGMSTA